MNLMLWTGAGFFRVKGSTNAWTYSTRRSGAALKDMCLRDILAVNKNCHGRIIRLKPRKNQKNQTVSDDAIDNCECERLREKFVSLREKHQQQHAGAHDVYRARIEEAIKSDPILDVLCTLKKLYNLH
jgi:hypothetical protein